MLGLFGFFQGLGGCRVWESQGFRSLGRGLCRGFRRLKRFQRGPTLGVQGLCVAERLKGWGEGALKGV